MTVRYVTIANADAQTQAKRNGWEPLKINGAPIGFLHKSLLNHFEGSTQKVQGAVQSQWYLAFFARTQYETSFLVSFFDGQPDESKVQKKDTVALAIWQTCTRDGPTAEQINRASEWLRGSAALKLGDYNPLRDDLLLAVDGAAISVFGCQQHRFERFVLLLALACAYRQRIQGLTEKMGEWSGCSKELSRLIRHVAEFNARHYFRNPVRTDLNELPVIWDLIFKRMRLDELNQELLEQLQALHSVVAADERDKEARRWRRVGVGFSIISSIQVLSLVPDEIRLRFMNTIMHALGMTP